jgi:hypothetical protein
MATDRCRGIVPLAALVLCAGCTLAGGTGRRLNDLAITGLAYTSTTRPLMTNLDMTPVAVDSSSNNVKVISVQNFDVSWGDEGIGAIARERGIAEVYYADIETTRYLGFFRRDRVRIYGRSVDAPAPPGAAIPEDDDTGQ